MGQRVRLKKNRNGVKGYAVKKREASAQNNSSSHQNNSAKRKIKRKRR